MSALLWLLSGCEPSAPISIVVQGPDGTHEVKPCSSGCARPEHPVHVEHEQLDAWLDEFAALPVGAESLAADSLLFYGHETHELLEHHDHKDLPPEHLAWLQRELARDTVNVSFRLVDDDGGRLLAHHEDVFPWVEHQDFLLEDTGELGRISMNGKVKRVGAHHLWARF